MNDIQAFLSGDNRGNRRIIRLLLSYKLIKAKKFKELREHFYYDKDY